MAWLVLPPAAARGVGWGAGGGGAEGCTPGLRGWPVAVIAAQMTGSLTGLPGTGLPAASAGVLGFCGNAAAAAAAAEGADVVAPAFLGGAEAAAWEAGGASTGKADAVEAAVAAASEGLEVPALVGLLAAEPSLAPLDCCGRAFGAGLLPAVFCSDARAPDLGLNAVDPSVTTTASAAGGSCSKTTEPSTRVPYSACCLPTRCCDSVRLRLCCGASLCLKPVAGGGLPGARLLVVGPL